MRLSDLQGHKSNPPRSRSLEIGGILPDFAKFLTAHGTKLEQNFGHPLASNSECRMTGKFLILVLLFRSPAQDHFSGLLFSLLISRTKRKNKYVKYPKSIIPFLIRFITFTYSKEIK